MSEQNPEQTPQFSVADEIIEDLAQKNAALTKENSFLRVALKQRDQMIEEAQKAPSPNRAARRAKGTKTAPAAEVSE